MEKTWDRVLELERVLSNEERARYWARVRPRMDVVKSLPERLELLERLMIDRSTASK